MDLAKDNGEDDLKKKVSVRKKNANVDIRTFKKPPILNTTYFLNDIFQKTLNFKSYFLGQLYCLKTTEM